MGGVTQNKGPCAKQELSMDGSFILGYTSMQGPYLA